MGALRDFLQADHRAMEVLLDRSVAESSARGGQPLERAQRLRRDHAAIAALMVPTPDAALVTELRSLLEPHDALEEGAGGVYEECELLVGARAAELLEQARAYPMVPVAKHFDGHGTVRTARDAVALADRVRLRARSS